MRVTLKLFAVLREKAGAGQIELELPDSATAAEAAEVFAGRYPAARDALRTTAFAINRAYAPPTASLRDGDELALIPPVSGG